MDSISGPLFQVPGTIANMTDEIEMSLLIYRGLICSIRSKGQLYAGLEPTYLNWCYRLTYPKFSNIKSHYSTRSNMPVC